MLGFPCYPVHLISLLFDWFIILLVYYLIVYYKRYIKKQYQKIPT